MKTGYLFAKSSVGDMAAAMLWFKENRYAAYTNAANAYEHAMKNFDQERLAGKFENHLYNLIAGKQ
jgi:glycosyltransferase involved in cell wall biosynthesis